MKYELKKDDLIALIRGIDPSYEIMSFFEKKELGSYTGGFKDEWDWTYKSSSVWDKFSEDELYKFYLYLKNGILPQ